MSTTKSFLDTIINFFTFDTTSDSKPLKYDTNDIMTLDDEMLKNLANKLNPSSPLYDKLIEIAKTNIELRKHISDTLKADALNDDSKKALKEMYLRLLQAELRIILREAKTITEKGKEVQNDVKDLFNTLTKKFDMINNYLEKESNFAIIGGGKNSKRAIHYCKYIKYKIKYENLRNNI